MKWIGRILVFIACFLSGTAVPLVMDAIDGHIATSVTKESQTDHVPRFAPTGLHISYIGWRPGDVGFGSARISLAVYNGLPQPVRYLSHSPGTPNPSLRINGAEIQRIYGCGTGIKTYQILPGQTAEFEVDAFYFTQTPKPNDQITVGFDLMTLTSGKSEIYYSEPFIIPQEFQQEIIGRRGELNETAE